MTPQEAHKAWQEAEEAYHEESRRYFVIRDASEPFEPVKAAAELTALREAAQAAQDAYVEAVASQAKDPGDAANDSLGCEGTTPPARRVRPEPFLPVPW